VYCSFGDSENSRLQLTSITMEAEHF
jgi:hypothetical protein